MAGTFPSNRRSGNCLSIAGWMDISIPEACKGFGGHKRCKHAMNEENTCVTSGMNFMPVEYGECSHCSALAFDIQHRSYMEIIIHLTEIAADCQSVLPDDGHGFLGKVEPRL